MATRPPYEVGYPPMPTDWQSNTIFELGWISGLFKVANKTINNIFGVYDEFTLNDDDILNFDHLDSDTFTGDSVGPIIYLSIWTALLVIFAIAGFCWCLCQKCCCCCRTNFKNGKNTNDFQDTYSQRNSKKYGGISVIVIVLSVIMAIWLIGFLIMILHTFASNDKTKDAIDQIQPDLENAIDDVNNYLDTTKSQLVYSFKTSSNTMKREVDGILEGCSDCGPIEEPVNTALLDTVSYLTSSSDSLEAALNEVQDAIEEGKNELDGDFEDVIRDANKGLYWFFMLFNLLYCAIFGLILVGTVLAAFARGGGLKTSGFLVNRGAIVLMFIVGLFVIIQLMVLFVAGGVVSEIICPAVKELEADPVTRNLHLTVKNSSDVSLKQKENDGEYEVPKIGDILRACKNDESAYRAFNLKTAYDIEGITEITNYFESLPEHRIKTDILNSVERYRDFVKKSTEEQLGKCKPVYTAINATISLFCDKITAPITSYWFILQFVLPTFVFIIVTALFLERFT